MDAILTFGSVSYYPGNLLSLEAWAMLTLEENEMRRKEKPNTPSPAALPTNVDSILWGTLFYAIGTIMIGILLKIVL